MKFPLTGALIYCTTDGVGEQSSLKKLHSRAEISGDSYIPRI